MSQAIGLSERWGVIGHTWAVEALERAISVDRAAHAFLFTGPLSIGKMTLARALARRLECESSPAPCGVCTPCRKLAKNVSPDVREIEGVPTGWKLDRDGPPPPRKNDRERRILKIEQIRDLQPWLATAPFESKYKIVILRRFEEANEEAANAFLKTLEEPPSYVFLILTAQDAGLLLPTIVSRCQRMGLHPLPIASVEEALLEKWKVSAQEARLLARLSGGRLGWAVRAASDGKIMKARMEALEALHGLEGEGRAEQFTRAAELAKAPEELPQILEVWLTWWRDLLLLQGGIVAEGGVNGARLTNVDQESILHAQAERFTTEDIQAALQATRAAGRQLEQNANARLVMEVLALNLPRGKEK